MKRCAQVPPDFFSYLIRLESRPIFGFGLLKRCFPLDLFRVIVSAVLDLFKRFGSLYHPL